MSFSIWAAIGVYAFVWWLYENILSSLIPIVWHSAKQLIWGRQKLADRYGSWAVVTGATDGIGKSYAVHLARLGMNLVLISRTEAKLTKVAREIQNDSGVQVKWIVADFSAGSSVYSRIWKELKFVDVGILVNNVGFAPEPVVEHFESHSDQDYLRIVNINILSVLLMTHMVLPHMKQVRRGIIVNVSSNSANYPPGFMTAYAASKSFGHSLTIALQGELRGTGVECQLVVPQFVRTNMTEKVDLSWFGGSILPDGDSYGRWATWTIGKTDHTCGYWLHSLCLALNRLLPSSINRFLATTVLRKQVKMNIEKTMQNSKQ